MKLVCLDLEGVLVPEIWIKFAEKSGIDALKITTRDLSDYDELMRERLSLLIENSLTIYDVQEVIKEINPFPGAKKFLDSLRNNYQVVILSDTFYELSKPLMKKLGWPTLFCHRLEYDHHGIIRNYHLRQKDAKKNSVISFKKLNFNVIASGDSYNDLTMLKEADKGILFNAPSNIITENPQFKSVDNYQSLYEEILY